MVCAMKNTFKFLFGAAIAALTVVSCSQELEYDNTSNEQTPDENAITIKVHASADEIKADEPEVKTYLGTYQGKENTVLWGTGEYMKLAVTAGETTHFATSAEANANGSPSATFSFSVDAFEGTPSSFTYQGLYPASAAVASNNTNPANYKVNLPSTQNATASSYDPAAYIMVAQPTEKTSVDDWDDASFRRATALNNITLKNVPSGVSIKRVEITAPTGKYLAGGRHFNLATTNSDEVFGDIYQGGGRTETVEVKFATPQAGGANIDVWFCSWGVEVETGENLTIVAYTTDKKSYTKTITVPSGKSIKFQEGYLNTLGANMSGIDPENVTELEEGTYLVLANNNGTYYALKAEAEGTRMNYESYDGSTLAYAGSNSSIIWTISKSEGSYIFANGSNYLGWTSGNTAAINEPGESWTTTNYLLDATYDSTNSCYSVTVHSESSRILAKNTGTYGFAFYTGSGYNQIIFVPATLDNRTEVSLSFDNDQVNLTPAEAAQYLGEDLTVSPDVAAVNQHLTWTYEDNDGIINEFDNGALTLTGDEGTATVSVSFTGDENYLPASASYTITVSAASGPQYELVSDANDVVAGDYIITWNNTYYLPSGSTSGTNPAVGTGITVAGNKITNTVTSDMIWTFIGDNTNGFTISDGTNILHSTNAAQGISINTTSTRKWTVSVDDTKGMVLHGDDGGSRYLAVYNSATWRYYALDNNYSGTLRLYKLADNREDAPISWSAAAGTATMSSSGINSTLPSLTNTSSLAVSYASSDEAVATIANDGTVTILSGGPTTISATYDGSAANAPYKTTTVSYTLTVTDNRTACATPSFSPAAGEVESGDEITISSATTGATIYYTTGNSEFSAGDWTEYTAPVEVTSACTIKAIAIKANYLNSAVASATYTIAASASTIAQVLAGGAGTYTINNILVYSVVGNQAIVGDSTGKMVLYKSGHGLEVGDNISIPSATVAEYNGILQIQDGTFNENSNGNAVDHGTATNLNDATVASNTLSTFSASGYHAATFVTLNGNQSGRNINGTNASLYLSAANTTYDGQAVIVTGYIYYYNDTHSNYNFQLVSIGVDNTIPSVSVSPASLSWAADETDGKTLTVTLNGAAASGDYGYSVTSGTAGDWNISNNGSGTITVSPKAANTSTTDAKSITLRISHADDSTVYQDVTCTQAKASGGSTKSYTMTIDHSTLTQLTSGSGYATYNGSRNITATATDNSTIQVSISSNQVLANTNNLQWQKSKGYIYNSTDLGTIQSVTVNSTSGSFTTYYGTTEHPTTSTTVGNGYFTVAVGSATGYTTSIVVTFTK